ncbi:MAG: class I SAM-dependent methyltransferase [Vicinamibacterales bacterium]
MDLSELQRHWHAFGEQDPLWAILTDPARKGGRWSADDFFATGTAEIDALLAVARGFGLPRERRRALDFGCGVGRLTQALAAHVDHVRGLDVAPSMIARAAAYNRHGARVEYAVQAAPPFTGVPSRSIDLVYTGRVLQHIAPEYSRQYIAELARVLAPGGFLSFDVPGRWLDAPAMPPGAMPPGAYRARLDARRRPGPPDRIAVDVAVTNTGDSAWPAGTDLNIGNHWLTASGATVVADDRRAAVPLPLAPGASAVVEFSTALPENPDAAVLEFDVVHEGVAWFAWHGSPTVRLVCRGTSAGESPEMPSGEAVPAPAPAAAGRASEEPPALNR